MDAEYGLASTGNSELRFRWTRLCIRAEHASILPSAIQFITSQGRMKFVRPIYRVRLGGSAVCVALCTHLMADVMWFPCWAAMSTQRTGCYRRVWSAVGVCILCVTLAFLLF